jgi:MinD-like ATPase involved in chromosome partitioning or flagellar assembly
MNPNTYTITFYSFKGGVGRTMALVNVAAQLAKMGRTVLLVDFDLEAPGLETFNDLRSHPHPHPGMVEYVTEYMDTNRAPDVRGYIYEANSIREKIGKNGGKVWVMPAGRRDAQYQSDLAKINWVQLYDKRDGFLLFEDTKAQWKKVYEPDYVLIDSRTGHTDVEGICTRQLPDAVVALFILNEQNLVGLRHVCDCIRDEQTSGLEKRIRLHFVESQKPNLDDEGGDLHRLREKFRGELRIADLSTIHRYEDKDLFKQSIFVLDRANTKLAAEYEQLVWSLIIHNRGDREGALLFLNEYFRYLPAYANDPDPMTNAQLGLPDPIADPLGLIVQNFPNDTDVLAAVEECRDLERGYQVSALSRRNG